jgi:ribonuclease BN (tRNA processing enzyme)
VKLTIVGSAPAYTLRAGASSSCYLVELGDHALVLDLGQGSFSQLAAHRRPEDIDGVLVSHLHADHLVDLVPLRHYLRYEAEADGRVTLRGPHELRKRFDAFQGETGFLKGLPGEPLEPGSFRLAGFDVETRHVTHIADSFAFRVMPPDGAGPGIVYSGDCARETDLLPLIRPGDTLLCEAAFGSGESGGGMHLTARQAARAAAEGGASRLLLTHILDSHDGDRAAAAAAEVFDGAIAIARPGLAVVVGEG